MRIWEFPFVFFNFFKHTLNSIFLMSISDISLNCGCFQGNWAVAPISKRIELKRCESNRRDIIGDTWCGHEGRGQLRYSLHTYNTILSVASHHITQHNRPKCLFSVPENLFPHAAFCTKKQQQKRSEKKTLKTKKQTEKEEEEEEGNGTKTLQIQTGQWGKLAQLRANQKRQQSFEIGLASACCCFLFSSSSSPGQVNNKKTKPHLSTIVIWILANPKK